MSLMRYFAAPSTMCVSEISTEFILFEHPFNDITVNGKITHVTKNIYR
jgi:hypothetical protein